MVTWGTPSEDTDESITFWKLPYSLILPLPYLTLDFELQYLNGHKKENQYVCLKGVSSILFGFLGLMFFFVQPLTFLDVSTKDPKVRIDSAFPCLSPMCYGFL